MYSRKKKHNEQGVTIIEVALTLPLFLMGLFFVLWIGIIVNARSALVNGVENAVRLGATRGNADLYNKYSAAGIRIGAIEALDSWRENTAILPGDGRDSLLQYGSGSDLVKVDDKVTDLFDSSASFPSGPPASLKELPVQYAYAMAYVAQSLRLGVNKKVRYPCDPYAEDGDDCLLCGPVNPATLSSASPTSPSDSAADLNRDVLAGDTTLVARRLAIKCDYKPGGVFLRPMLALMSVVSGQNGGSSSGLGVVSHTAYFGRDSNCYVLAPTFLRPEFKYCCNGKCG